MKNIIRYCVDGIVKQKDKNTIAILGWAFETETKTPVKIEIADNEHITDVRLKKVARTDLKHIYNIPYENEMGFYIELVYDAEQGNAVIELIGEADRKQIVIDLSKAYYEQDAGNQTGNIYINKIRNGIRFYKDNGLKATINKMRGVSYLTASYREWINKYEIEGQEDAVEALQYRPLISIIVPVYNVDIQCLKACIESVIAQSYQNWELCLADDHSTDERIRPVLADYSARDPRIKVVFREKNGHICKASNSALTLADGEYIALLDNDDLLSPHALYQVVRLINDHPDAEFIYSDEDKIDMKGKRFDPYFKSDWAPDTLMCQNYICHFTVIKKALVDRVGGFEVGLEGSQDYDLFLKCTEQTTHIYHIPEILYHWRMIKGSTADNPEAKNYAYEAGKRALENALVRRNIEGRIIEGNAKGTYLPVYTVKDQPMVSVVIPTKDHADDLKRCVDSVFRTAGYDRFEIIIVDNNSEEQKTFDYFAELEKTVSDQVRILKMPIPFNYSRLNNAAVEAASGEYILLLNNDIEMITDGWMALMLGYAQLDHIGAVGSKLVYDNNSIQHAGVILGIRGVAGHGFKYLGKNDTVYFNRLNIAANYSAVTAACLMVKKDKYLQVGGLNEDALKVAFNDVDFCLKLGQAGYKNVCLGQMEAYHYESKSRGVENTSGKIMRFQNEINYMIETWGDLLQHDPYYNKNLTLDREDYGIRS